MQTTTHTCIFACIHIFTHSLFPLSMCSVLSVCARVRVFGGTVTERNGYECVVSPGNKDFVGVRERMICVWRKRRKWEIFPPSSRTHTTRLCCTAWWLTGPVVRMSRGHVSDTPTILYTDQSQLWLPRVSAALLPTTRHAPSMGHRRGARNSIPCKSGQRRPSGSRRRKMRCKVDRRSANIMAISTYLIEERLTGKGWRGV